MKHEFSVIVPVYNEEKYIRECCASIEKSIFPDYEIIIIDDNSTDTTYSVCKELEKNNDRIHVYRNNGIKGPAAARNIGLNKANGKYVIFVDADDTISMDCLEVFHECFEKNGAELVIADAVRIDIQGNHYEKPWKLEDKYLNKQDINIAITDFLKNERAHRILCSVWGKAFRLEIIQKANLRFDEDLRTYEDELFFFNYLILCNNCFYKKQPLYTYYRNRNNTGSSSVLMNPLAFKKTLKLIKIYLSTGNIDDDLEKLYGRAYCEYTVSACYHFVRLTRISGYMELKSAIRELRQMLYDKEFRENIKYYDEPDVNNSKLVVCFAKRGWAWLTWFVFKGQIARQKRR